MNNHPCTKTNSFKNDELSTIPSLVKSCWCVETHPINVEKIGSLFVVVGSWKWRWPRRHLGFWLGSGELTKLAKLFLLLSAVAEATAQQHLLLDFYCNEFIFDILNWLLHYERNFMCNIFAALFIVHLRYDDIYVTFSKIANCTLMQSNVFIFNLIGRKWQCDRTSFLV